MTTHGTASDSPPTDPREKPDPLSAGHRLAEFELLEVVGDGGFGIVYRAYDHSLQRHVAIKEYMPAMLATRRGDHSVHVRSARLTASFEAGLRSFINEARTLAQFSHPALVQVHRFWESNATAYMAIELYEGRTLRRLVEDEPSKITEPWLLGMLGPLLGALETLHRRQCFHRDIAPDNIFVQHDDMPVLLDFGAARKSIADLADEVAVMVKSGYSPIEQYADDNALQQGAWTDLYALGAVLYRAVTGHPPPSAVVRSVQDAHVPLMSMNRTDLSAAFCTAVDRTLAVHSTNRTQTTAAFAAELGLVKLGDVYAIGRGTAAIVTALPTATERPLPSPSPPRRSLPPQPTGRRAPASPSPAVREPANVRRRPPSASPPKRSTGGRHEAASSARKPMPQSWSVMTGMLMMALTLVVAGGWLGHRWAAGKQNIAAAKAPVHVPPPPSFAHGMAQPAVVTPSNGASDARTATVTADTNTDTGTGTGTAAGAVTGTAISSAIATDAMPPTASIASPAAEHPTWLGNAPSGAVPAAASGPRTMSATAEFDDWSLARSENSREGYEAYLRRYRRGPHSWDARNAIAALRNGAPTAPVAPGTTPRTSRPHVPATSVNSATTTAQGGAGTATTSPSVGVAAALSMGRVILNIRPWGQVFVDGADRGVSPPLKSLSLRQGSYDVEVRNGDLDVYRQRVTVQDGQPAPVVGHEFK